MLEESPIITLVDQGLSHSRGMFLVDAEDDRLLHSVATFLDEDLVLSGSALFDVVDTSLSDTRITQLEKELYIGCRWNGHSAVMRVTATLIRTKRTRQDRMLKCCN